MASPQSSQPIRPSQLTQTVTRALRTLGRSEDIQCTRSLIQAYNANDAEDEMGVALHQWLDAYVDEFSKRKAECTHENLIREYALLAMINVNTSEAAELVRRVYVSLRVCIRADAPCSSVIVVALENMLRVMDLKIVEKEAQSLVSLANDLLSLTDPKKCIFTRDTYAFHMACLLTLERILIVLHHVERARSKQDVVEFFRNKLRTHLNSIAAKQRYYPFVYNTQLIRCNIDGLIKGDRTEMLLNAGRRAFYALCGGLYLFQGVRELAVMRLDFAAIDAGMQKMQQAFSGFMDTRIPGLQEVMQAATKSEESQDFSHIMECYAKHKSSSFMTRMVSKEPKIVKFALVSHLTLFAIDTSANDLSDQAFRLLSRLAVDDDTTHWRVDPDVYESLLDALASIGATKQMFRQDCLMLLHQMEITSVRKHQTVVNDWRGFNSIEQMLDMKCDNESEIPVVSLFDAVRKQLGLHLTHERNLELKQELTEYYQDEKFAKVSLLLDDINKRHIADLDFHLVEYELADTKNPATHNASSADDDQMAHNWERSSWVQKTIKLQDIFARKRQESSGPEEEVSSVLLLGSPGTGKTSLSKRLCYEWATREWGSEFRQVYLLPIRELSRNRLQSVTTLEAAISVLLFKAHSKSEDEQNALQYQIKDELTEQTTLLMLDGLDEANGNDMAEQIVGDALSRSCNILVLSRPHNLGDVRSKMDTQVECLGLSDDQLKAFVRTEVPDTSEELVQFLRKSPMVWEIAQIPINAQILCTLWRSEAGQSLKELKSVNLKTLYSAMIEYVWKRFEEKATEKVDRKSVFSSLESIAFKSISKGKIEIPREFLMMNPQDTTTSTLLDSGFLLFYMEGQVFQFAHLSFHEFFAGQYLAKALRGTEKEIKEARKYIAERKYYDTSRVILSFMTQCFCKEEDASDEEDCIERLKQLLRILDKDPVEVVGFQHLMLKLRTLDAFLSVCGNCAKHICSDDDLQRVVQPALVLLTKCMRQKWNAKPAIRRRKLRLEAIYDRIMVDFGRMPSLFVYLPELLLTVLKHYALVRNRSDFEEIARLVSHSPGQLLQIVPMELQDDDSDEVEDGCRICLFMWLKLFAEAGPECAVLALEQLNTACKSQSEDIRRAGFQAIVYFVKVLPDRKDLHFLCRDVIKDESADVCVAFIERLKSVTFEPNSAAANLAWTLTVEATKNADEKVRRQAFISVLREDQTSEETIGKMIELLLEFIPTCVADEHRHFRQDILKGIVKFLSRFPAKLSAFLPYLASCFLDLFSLGRVDVLRRIDELCSCLPTPQARELGEMIARIYGDAEDPDVRVELLDALYKIGRKIPNFMTEFQDVFSRACDDTNDNVRTVAKTIKAAMIVLASATSVDAITEVFWDQSFGIKNELLSLVKRERMINAETAEVVVEMAVNCLESNNEKIQRQSLDALATLIRFRSLSSKVLHHILDYTNSLARCWGILYEQPVDILLECFWDINDEEMVSIAAQKLTLASFTYKAAEDGISIVSVFENGKKTQQEVPTELVEKLIGLVKQELRSAFVNIFP